MAHAFKTTSAKPTFGTIRENLYQSDYINRKKGIINFCKTPSVCYKIRSVSSYNTRHSFNTGRLALSLATCNRWPVNKSNLIIKIYTNETNMASPPQSAIKNSLWLKRRLEENRCG